MTEMTYLEAEMLSVGFLANFLWINHLFTIQTANPPRIVNTKPTSQFATRGLRHIGSNFA